MTEPIKAWAIKFPDGHFHFWQWEDSEAAIQMAFCDEQNERWTSLWNEGYRAVRVEIREVEEHESK